MNLYETDPEFMALSEAFAYEEVAKDEEIKLDDRAKYLSILSTIIASGGKEEFEVILDRALTDSVDPVAIKEMVYQSVDYLGLSRMRGFLEITNTVMLKHGIALPLSSQATTDKSNRLEKGVEKQVELFGPQRKEAYKKGKINTWLASNCFGDYYTRTGLSNREREMITFCFLSAQGGCESQLIAHAKANLMAGNDKEYMMKVILNSVPYIGYPRSLNAISALNKAAEN